MREGVQYSEPFCLPHSVHHVFRLSPLTDEGKKLCEFRNESSEVCDVVIQLSFVLSYLPVKLDFQIKVLQKLALKIAQQLRIEKGSPYATGREMKRRYFENRMNKRCYSYSYVTLLTWWVVYSSCWRNILKYSTSIQIIRILLKDINKFLVGRCDFRQPFTVQMLPLAR